jgi:hypothetical protein
MPARASSSVLNRDGSLKAVLPPTLTAEERAEQEARDRKAAAERAAQAGRRAPRPQPAGPLPDRGRARKAREAALDTVRLAIKATDCA